MAKKIELEYEIDNRTECWNVTSHIPCRNGYVRLYLGGRYQLAHRFNYERYFGTIPDDMLVCHHCDNPRCINPKHLFLGTTRDNVRDRVSKGRSNVQFGEEVHNAMLTKEQVIFIREQVGIVQQKDLAKMFGISRSEISLIQTGKVWKHLL